MQGMERRHYARNRRNDDVELQNMAANSKSFYPEVKVSETAKHIEKLYEKKDLVSMVTDFHISDWELNRHDNTDVIF